VKCRHTYMMRAIGIAKAAALTAAALDGTRTFQDKNGETGGCGKQVNDRAP